MADKRMTKTFLVFAVVSALLFAIPNGATGFQSKRGGFPDEGTSDDGSDADEPMTNATSAGGDFRVYLKDGSKLIGKIDEKPSLLFKAVIGKIGIPLRNLVGIEFNEKADKTKIIFVNGDRLTGRIESDTVKFKADWGEVKLELSSISKIYAKDLPKGFYLKRVSVRSGRTVNYVDQLIYNDGSTRSAARSAPGIPGMPGAFPGGAPASPFGDAPGSGAFGGGGGAGGGGFGGDPFGGGGARGGADPFGGGPGAGAPAPGPVVRPAAPDAGAGDDLPLGAFGGAPSPPKKASPRAKRSKPAKEGALAPRVRIPLPKESVPSSRPPEIDFKELEKSLPDLGDKPSGKKPTRKRPTKSSKKE